MEKHYRAIAEIIRQEIPGPIGGIYRVGRWDAGQDIAEKLADYFKQDNPRFDQDKFLAACGAD